MGELKRIIYDPVLLIEFHGHPVNQFVPQVFNSEGEYFDTYFLSHNNSIHNAYVQGYKKLKEAMSVEGTLYRIEKYPIKVNHKNEKIILDEWCAFIKTLPPNPPAHITLNIMRKLNELISTPY